MTETPSHQTNADAAEGKPDKDISAIIGPKALTMPKPPPTPNENGRPAKRRRWTNDPGIFWVTVAGVIAVAAYTTVAKLQLDEMKIQRISSQRAFMTVKGIEFQSLPFLGRKGAFWIATSVLENSGNTPTKNMLVVTRCAQSFEPLVDPSKIEKTNLLYSSQTVDFRKMVFGPKQIANGGFCAISAMNALFSFIPGDIHLYVYGNLIYQDIFDERTVHVTQFCFDNLSFSLGGSADEPTMSAFTMACRVHNCVDEECAKDVQDRAASFMIRKIKVFRIPSMKRLLARIQENAKAAVSKPAN